MTVRPLRHIALAAAAPLVLAACLAPADLPPRSAGVTGPAPTLLPMSEVTRLAGASVDAAQLTATTEARANALRARAARLRGPVIAVGERQSLLASAVAAQG